MESNRVDPELAETATLPGRSLPSDALPRRDSVRELAFAPEEYFGGYRLIRLLGTGGFAEVWEAERLLDGRHVALKVLKTTHALSEESQARFEREGRTAGSLSHPRTVYVFAAEVIEGHPTIAMEIVHGGSLQDRLKQEGPLPAHQAVDAILDVIDGLEAASRLGIVHRDMKPSNCFVDDAGRVKVGDFGISRSVDSDVTLTATGAFIGTPAFTSPEQIKGEPLDHRSDLYSVGATLYSLLSGRPPFDAANAVELLACVLMHRPVPFSKRGVRVPGPLEAIVMRLLAKDPARRYPSYDALRSALLPFSSREAQAADPTRRFGAYLVDVVLWYGVACAALFGMYGPNALAWIQGPTAEGPLVAAALFAARVLAFGLLEWRWQRTPGKHLFHLSVRSLSGPSLSPAQALLRNLSFWTLHDALSWGAAFAPSLLPVFSIMGAMVPCLSMRKANGYAGLHDLLSRTAVRVLHDSRREMSAPAYSTAVAPRVAPPAEVEHRGPYRVVHEIWRTEDASLILASDDLLNRSVWIHETSKPNPAAARSDASQRAARLRWIQGGRSSQHDGVASVAGRPTENGGGRWDAYEAPSGASLSELVRAKGRLEWSEAREIVLQLAREIAAGLDAKDLPERLTVAHLWVDAFGHLKVLEFPVEANGADDRKTTDEWKVLIPETALLVLEGPAAAGGEARSTSRAPRVPLPGRARAALGRLFAEPLDRSFLGKHIDDLDEVCARPASISRLVRSAHLLFAWSVPGIAAIGAFLGALESLHQRSNAAGGFGDVVMTVAGGLDSALITLGLASIFGVLLAFVFRGGPVLRCFGTIVQERDGAPASRARCMLRGTIALLPPFLVSAPVWIIALLVISGVWSGAAAPSLGLSAINDWVTHIGSIVGSQARGVPEGVRIVAVLGASLLGLVFLVGTGLAVLRPDRSIQDRIAGTRLVPR